MPVTSKAIAEAMREELRKRFDALLALIQGRELLHNREGRRRNGKHVFPWKTPGEMCGTVGTACEIRIAVADFKTILAEYTRLK